MQAELQQSRGGNPVAGDRWIDSAWRNRGWILGPVFAALVLSVVVAFLWPDTFRSTAVVESQSADPTALTGRILKITSSRQALQSLIAAHDLYPGERQRLPLEDVVDNMSRQIRVSPAIAADPKSEAVRISFDYSDRFKAQQVVQDLLSRLLAGNGAETPTAPGIEPAPPSDLTESAAKDLADANAKLDEYRAAHDGLLPDQVEVNQIKMAELETRRTRLSSDLSRARSEQADLQTQVASQQERRRTIKEFIDVPAPPKPANKQLADLNRQILAVEARIKTLREQYTEKFPDVIDARQRLAALQTQRDALARADAANAPGPTRQADPEAMREAAEMDANIKSLQTRIAAKATEIGELNKESAEVDDDIQAMLARFKQVPSGDKEYADLLRDRDLKQAQFDEAEIKAKAAQEGQQAKPAQTAAAAGGTLRPLEAPSLPAVPISPNRALIVGGGTLAGLLLGLVLAGTREIRMLAAAPADGEIAVPAPPKSRWLVWLLSAVAGGAAMASAVAHHYLGSY